MRILVTGAGGFLGTWITRELLKNTTYLVTNFSRHAHTHLDDMGVPTIRGDLRSPADIEHAVAQGFDVIIHVASLVGMWGKAETFDAINVEGTRLLLEAAQKHGVKRFVYTGSPSAVFGKGGHAGADETLPYPEEHLGHYPRTKALAEQLVLAANRPGFATCSLRPHLVWGPGDQNLLPRVIQKARVGKLKVVGDGENQVDVLYVENAARAHVMAMEALAHPGSPVAGQAYFLGQGPVKLWGFISDVFKHAEVEFPDDQISRKKALLIGRVMEKTWKVLGLNAPEPPMTRFVALNLSTDHWFSHAKAERDFGWRPEIGLEEGLARTFRKRQEYRHLLAPGAQG